MYVIWEKRKEKEKKREKKSKVLRGPSPFGFGKKKNTKTKKKKIQKGQAPVFRGGRTEAGKGGVFNPPCRHTRTPGVGRRGAGGVAGGRRRTPSRPPPRSRANPEPER